MRIPFCQVMCSAIYERIGRLGFTDFLGMFNSSETPCIQQGTSLAQILGYLRMRTQISVFGEELELVSIDSFDPIAGVLPYPYSELIKPLVKLTDR